MHANRSPSRKGIQSLRTLEFGFHGGASKLFLTTAIAACPGPIFVEPREVVFQVLYGLLSPFRPPRSDAPPAINRWRNVRIEQAHVG